jgi:hypothetical protein
VNEDVDQTSTINHQPLLSVPRDDTQTPPLVRCRGRFTGVSPVADACPMCKLANEEGTDPQAAAVANARPRAYMYSILFMLSMPATLTGAFGIAFYRMHIRQRPPVTVPETDGDTAPAILPETNPA